MIKSFKGEWLDLISVFIQDNKIRTLLNAVWLSEDAMLDFFIFFWIILRTFLLLINNVMTIKKLFYVGVWINRIIKAFICSFPFYWWVLKLRVIKILTFGGQKLFTGSKKTNLKAIENKIIKIELNCKLHSLNIEDRMVICKEIEKTKINTIENIFSFKNF